MAKAICRNFEGTARSSFSPCKSPQSSLLRPEYLLPSHSVSYKIHWVSQSPSFIKPQIHLRLVCALTRSPDNHRRLLDCFFLIKCQQLILKGFNKSRCSFVDLIFYDRLDVLGFYCFPHSVCLNKHFHVYSPCIVSLNKWPLSKHRVS